MNVGNVADPDVLLSGGGIQDEASLAPKLSENMLRSASNAFKNTASQDLCDMFIDFYFFISAKQKRSLQINCCLINKQISGVHCSCYVNLSHTSID